MAVAAAFLAVGGFAIFGPTASKLADPVAEAATVSSNTGGYRAHISLQMDSSESGWITGVADARVDLPHHAADISLVMNDPALSSSPVRGREIVDGTTFYMKLPGTVLGERWLEFDLSKIPHLQGLSSLESDPMTSNPGELLEFLRAASTGVVVVGHQRVDGFETTHYRADLDLSAVPNVLPPADQLAAQQTVEALEQETGLYNIPVDVWIDSQHLVRRLEESYDTTLANGQTMSMSMTEDMSDYGPQSAPALPSSGDVEDLSSLLAGASQ